MPRVYSDLAVPHVGSPLSDRQRCWFCRKVLPRNSVGTPMAYKYLEWIVCPPCVERQDLTIGEAEACEEFSDANA